jgi:hypothetical protein
MRNNLLTKLLLSFGTLGLLLTTLVAQPQGPTAEHALDSMNLHLQTIRARTRNDHTAQGLIRSIDDSIRALRVKHAQIQEPIESFTTQTVEQNGSFITRVLKEEHVTTLDAEYLSSLQVDDELLAGLTRPGVNNHETSQTLKDVDDDLRIKIKYLDAGSFMQQTPVTVTGSDGNTVTMIDSQAGKIGVSAITKRGNNQTVNGYEVYYIPKGLLRRQPDRAKSFSSLSPTEKRDLSPGVYFMWTVRASNRTAPRPIPVGDAGPQQSVELSVP